MPGKSTVNVLVVLPPVPLLLLLQEGGPAKNANARTLALIKHVLVVLPVTRLLPLSLAPSPPNQQPSPALLPLQPLLLPLLKVGGRARNVNAKTLVLMRNAMAVVPTTRLPLLLLLLHLPLSLPPQGTGPAKNASVIMPMLKQNALPVVPTTRLLLWYPLR